MRARGGSRELTGGADVFKLKFPTGEFDMVVVDRASQEVELYEVKHATMRDDRQLRHLADGMKVAEVERLYGRVVVRTVLYRGQPAELPNGIRYRNVGEYLRSAFG